MGIVARHEDRKPRVPAGNYIARCYEIIHVGTNEATYKGETYDRNVVRIGWELPTELRTFDEDKGPQPMAISDKFTVSLGDRAILRRVLENWRGKTFTKEELKGFDLTKLIGVACMLSVVISDDGQYSNIGTVAPLPKGTVVPDPVNPQRIFDYENNFDLDELERLPDFIKDDIKTSHEYIDRMMALESQDQQKQMEAGEPHNETEEYEDDLPF